LYFLQIDRAPRVESVVPRAPVVLLEID